MRNPILMKLVLLLLGIVIGASGAATLVNTLHQRDAYPRGLMDVMQHHYAALRQDARQQHCDTSTVQHLDVLRELASSTETAVYADDTPDAPFHEYHQRLLNALTAIPDGATSLDCAALSAMLDKVGAACDACHRQYR